MRSISPVYRRYASGVHRFALYLSGDFALAQDITAETFARVWTVREDIRVGSIRGYLLMIARNRYRDDRRKATVAQSPDHADVRNPASNPGTEWCSPGHSC